jgi:cation diffusion facilitator family transporter
MSHVRKPLAAAAALNTLIFIGEGLAGIKAQSLSLIMDGIHNLSDEMALVFLFMAYLLPVALSKNFQRVANFLNSAGLVGMSVLLIWQAFVRLYQPTHVIGFLPIIVGLLAAAANGGVAAVLWNVREQNAAIRLAYVHNLGDVYVSLAPVASGILIALTSKYILDPLIAILIALWFIWSTVKEIMKSAEQLLWPEDAVCKHEALEILQHD